MIDCIFTIDYEIFGNGEGSLRELVYEPSQKLKTVLDRAGVKIVWFVEAAELQKIEEAGSDTAITSVKSQIRALYDEGHEIALHLHPQWANATLRDGNWNLDYHEYNLCTLPRDRISEIVSGAVGWLRGVVGDDHFKPFSFRAGNWLFQPTQPAADVLLEHGLRVDSSVFKGGLISSYGLDYRPALRNHGYWRFRDNVAVADSQGALLEIPIHSQMVPFWKMATARRISQQRRARGHGQSTRLSRFRDLVRWSYPRKFDFCRMTSHEMKAIVSGGLARCGAGAYLPLVAIGHSKDSMDFAAIEALLAFLKQRQVGTATLAQAHAKCANAVSA